MKRLAASRVGVAAMTIVLGALATPALANKAPPQFDPPASPKPPAPRLVIERVDNIKEATLVIPRKYLPAQKNADAAEKADAGLSPTRTVVAGIALALAIGFGGMQLIRRRGGMKTLAAVLLLGGGALALAVTQAQADIPPFPRPKPPPEPQPAPVVPLPIGVPVVVQIVEEGNVIKLIASPEHLRGPQPRPVPPPPPPGAAPEAP